MKQLLRSIILDWWNKPLPEIVPRMYDLLQYTALPFQKAICITGFRRVGKTYLLFDLANKLGANNCVYINFEDERLPRETQVLTTLLEVISELKGRSPITLLMDEIQNIPNWSLWARRVLDSTPHKLFLSGSSSKVSSNELPTEMRGRSLSVQIFPLNFSEFLQFKTIDPKTQNAPQMLHVAHEFLTYGGFPEVVLADEGKKLLLIDEYYQTFMLRDIVERHHIRNDIALKMFLRLLIESPYLTISKMTKNIKSQGLDISKPTISRYLEHLRSSYFLNTAFLHTSNLKNRLQAAQKPYLVDTGFISRLSSKFSQNHGRLLEQAVYQKLSVANEVYYWHDYQKNEVDFVIRENESVNRLIQACFVSEGEIMPEREVNALLKAGQEFACDDLTLVTWDIEKELRISDQTVKLIPLWKFLL